MYAEATIVTTRDKEIADEDMALTLDFVQTVIDDPESFEDVPNGVMLLLLPDDDPDFVASCIERGVTDIARGRNVYFRH